MREETTISSASRTALIKAMTDFFDKCDGYRVVYSVVHNIPAVYGYVDTDTGLEYYFSVIEVENSDVSVILMSYVDAAGYNVVAALATTDYDFNKEVFHQKDIICTKFYDYFPKALNRHIYTHYFPAPVLRHYRVIDEYVPNSNAKLIANYNEGEENNTIMFSCIETKMANDYPVTHTRNMVFGHLSKFEDYPGGFFYGGDFVYTIELTYNWEVRNVYPHYRSLLTFIPGAYFWNFLWHVKQWHPWRPLQPYVLLKNPYADVENITYSSSLPSPHNVNRFHCFLRIDVDEAPFRDGRELPIAQRTDYQLPLSEKFGINPATNMYEIMPDPIVLYPQSSSQRDPDIDYYEIPPINRRRIWATTLSTLGEPFYVPMVVSIQDQFNGLPTYKPLYTVGIEDIGHTVNTLNNISLMFELYFMCMRDPWVKAEYSCMGYSKIINYVNMRNMSTNAMEEGNFPTNKGKFNCFSMGTRRSMFGSRGYNGLAFKQEE